MDGALLGAAFAVGAVAVLSRELMGEESRSGWYRCVQSRLAPPPWVFGAAWGLLYILMTFAIAQSLRSNDQTLVKLWALNLALNLAWTPAFFGSRNPALGLAIIVGMGWSLVQIDDRAPSLRFCVIPYAAWLSLAALLNAEALVRDPACRR